MLSVSRMASLMACARQHFWRYEIGLRQVEKAAALRLGSAWAKGMEARWSGKSYDDALAFAIPEGVDLDAYETEIVAALLAGYYDHWGKKEKMAKIHAEVPFKSEIEGTPFISLGYIDGLGTRKDGLSGIVESKTTSYDVSPDSPYWSRLRFNMQVLQYVLEARLLGWDIRWVIYDVTRKPTIRPSTVNDLDEKGRKIVTDVNGDRVFVEKGKHAGEPVQGSSKEKGWTLKTHIETPAEYCDRLWNDTKARPDFYFARREVAVTDQDVDLFSNQRLAIANLILAMRSGEEDFPLSQGRTSCGRSQEAWPRNVSDDTCQFCEFRSFCLNNSTPDTSKPIPGFAIHSSEQRTTKEPNAPK